VAMQHSATVEAVEIAAVEVQEATLAAPVAESVGATPELGTTATPAAHVEAPAVQAAPQPVAPIPAVAPAAAPAAIPAADAIIVQPEPMPLDHLRDMLAAAGLTLAVTDPEKLRVAQEAAARVTPMPRVPRERKALPPVSNEPLIQVETRH
jgi:ribonuclease E